MLGAVLHVTHSSAASQNLKYTSLIIAGVCILLDLDLKFDIVVLVDILTARLRGAFHDLNESVNFNAGTWLCSLRPAIFWYVVGEYLP